MHRSPARAGERRPRGSGGSDRRRRRRSRRSRSRPACGRTRPRSTALCHRRRALPLSGTRPSPCRRGSPAESAARAWSGHRRSSAWLRVRPLDAHAGVDAAVHVEELSGHVVGGRRNEEGNDPGDIGGFSHPAPRDAACGPFARVARHLEVTRGLDETGGDRVHADLLRREVHRERAGERVERALRRRVRGVTREAGAAMDGAHADDRAAATLEVRYRLLRAEVRGAHVDAEELVVFGFGERKRITRLRDAGVVHQHVQAAKLGGGFVDHAPAIGDARQVSAHQRRAAAGGGDLDADVARALAAVRIVDRHGRALIRELARDALADAGARAGHERASTLEWPAHTRSRSRPRRCQRSPKRLRWICLRGCAAITSSSSVMPRPGPVGRGKDPSLTVGIPRAASLTNGSTKSLKCSRILKLGIAAARWRAAAVDTGPPTLCGATITAYDSAHVASFRVSVIPPIIVRSGWMMSAARRSKISRNSCRTWMRSPVATGTFTLRATFTSELMLSGGTGSSIQPGRYGSSSRAIAMACAGGKRPCISTKTSPSGPTPSRAASTSAIARRSSACGSSCHAVPNGSSFTARYPFASTARAASRMSFGVRSTVYQPFAYVGMRSRIGPPRS